MVGEISAMNKESYFNLLSYALIYLWFCHKNCLFYSKDKCNSLVTLLNPMVPSLDITKREGVSGRK